MYYILIIILNIFMPVICWGPLAKSAQDPTTIPEYIAAKILDHNVSSSAHGLDGYAVYNHRAGSLLDHPDESVQRKKMKFDRFQIDEPFNTLDVWDKTAEVEQTGYGGMDVQTSNIINNTASSYILVPEGMPEQAYLSQSPRWESRIKFSANTSQLAYFGLLMPSVPAGIGFKVSNGTLYAVYWDAGDVEQTTEITGITITDAHNYKLKVDSAGNTEWYVDDVLKKTVATSALSNQDSLAFYQIKTLVGAIRIMYVMGLHYDADYE